MDDAILELDNIRVEFPTPEGVVKAVNGVSLSLKQGETLAIVGEGGAGKSSLALTILNLLPPGGRIASGHVYYRGSDHEVDLLALSTENLRRVRGREIAMIFQDPVAGLNPVLPVLDQVAEIITTHLAVSKRQAKKQSLELLAQMGLPDPDQMAHRYPMHLSSGMAQRVMIATATALNPKVLIADEPTSALDVTVQAAILDDLAQMQRRHGTSILLISHDLGVVARMADRAAVMYAGSVVESAPVTALFQRPRHPYTWSLLASQPRWDQETRRPLPWIRGMSPDLIHLPPECPYLPRCLKATTDCRTRPAPALEELKPGHMVACFNPIYQQESGGEFDSYED